MSNLQSGRSEPNSHAPSRRGFLAVAASLAAAAGADFGARAARGAVPSPDGVGGQSAATEPFHGKHQGGIATPAQRQTYFAAFDLVANKREDVVQMLRTWTSAAAAMTAGQMDGSIANAQSSAGPPIAEAAIETTPPPTSDSNDDYKSNYGSSYGAGDISTADSGETIGLPSARLTLTFGFGAGLFVKNGKDRYGLAAQRPGELVDLPRFNGDQLMDDKTGGDISVQACADDPQVAFHAIRRLARLADGVAQLRWIQAGFIPDFAAEGGTPRNLMGFKDGTSNVSPSDASAMDKYVWVGTDGTTWMRGGSYVVVRRIRIALEHWDRMRVIFQEQTIGRRKLSGAPLTGKREFDAPDLNATDKDGTSIIGDHSHMRMAIADSNDGARIFRRPYSYSDGANFVSERWPPWRQGMELDAGLFFVCYQRDPRTGFIKIFDKMSKLDMLNQFTTHTGGGLFACPGGIAEGEYIGQRLFE